MGYLTTVLPEGPLEGVFLCQGPRRARRRRGLQTHAALPSSCTSGHRPRQAAASSEHPLVVVSTTQVDDWDESSSFLTERLLQVLPLSGTDLMSAGRSGVSGEAPGSSPGADTGLLPTSDVAGRHCLPVAARSPRPALCTGSDKPKGHPVLAGAGQSEAPQGGRPLGWAWQRSGRETSTCPSTRLASFQAQRGQIF